MPFKQFHPAQKPKLSNRWNCTSVLTPIFPNVRAFETVIPNVSNQEHFPWEPVDFPIGEGERVTTHLREIADANPLLKGIIDRVDVNATTHGLRDLDDDRLSNLIEAISARRLGLSDVEANIIGRSYEYLIRKFAEGSGQCAGAFYTPAEVGLVMAQIMDPQPGEDIYDPCCGSAGLLISRRFVRDAPPGTASPARCPAERRPRGEGGRVARPTPHTLHAPRRTDRSGSDPPQVADFIRLQHELMDNPDCLFVFVEHPAVDATNNRSERNARREAEIRNGARTSKTTGGATRRGVILTMLASLATRFNRFTRDNVLSEVTRWWESGLSLFQQELAQLQQPMHRPPSPTPHDSTQHAAGK